VAAGRQGEGPTAVGAQPVTVFPCGASFKEYHDRPGSATKYFRQCLLQSFQSMLPGRARCPACQPAAPHWWCAAAPNKRDAATCAGKCEHTASGQYASAASDQPGQNQPSYHDAPPRRSDAAPDHTSAATHAVFACARGRWQSTKQGPAPVGRAGDGRGKLSASTACAASLRR
jgi:hypothetical protein